MGDGIFATLRRRRAIALGVAVALIASACSAGPSPTPRPTLSPTASPTPIPSAREPVTVQDGGTLSLADGATVMIPAGAVSTDSTLSLAVVPGAAPAESDEWPAVPVSPVYQIALTADLTQPATLTLPFDPAQLPASVSPQHLLLAYQDPDTGTWSPVLTSVDATGAASASISHFSSWALFGFDPSHWLVVLKKLASIRITDLVNSVLKGLAGCSLSAGGFRIDDTNTHNMFEGCLNPAPANGKATVEVTNLRAFALSVSLTDGTLGQLLSPGESTSFDFVNTDKPPGGVEALMTQDALVWSVADILARFLPGWTELKASKDYPLVMKLLAGAGKGIIDIPEIWDAAIAGNFANAAERTVNLVTGDNYLEAFVAAANTAGLKYGLPWLTVVSVDLMKQILKVVSLGDLIVTTWSFFGDYLLGHAATSLSVLWTQAVTLPSAPTNLSFNATVDELNNVYDVTVKWSYPAGTTISGFRVYAAEVIGEPAPGSPAPKCPKPPFQTNQTLPDWTLVLSVGPSVRKVTFKEPFAPGIQCTWVAAWNKAGLSAFAAAGPNS